MHISVPNTHRSMVTSFGLGCPLFAFLVFHGMSVLVLSMLLLVVESGLVFTDEFSVVVSCFVCDCS